MGRQEVPPDRRHPADHRGGARPVFHRHRLLRTGPRHLQQPAVPDALPDWIPVHGSPLDPAGVHRRERDAQGARGGEVNARGFAGSKGTQDSSTRERASPRTATVRRSPIRRAPVSPHNSSMASDTKPKGGLEDVVAATSAICYLDGDRGVLAYFGYDIHDLARGATFEEVCHLLWHGRLPTRAELGDLQSQLAAARPLGEPILRLMRQLPAVDGMDMLRTLTSALAHYDPDAADNSQHAHYRKAVRLTAQIGSLVATYGRLQAGGGAIQPDPALGHAA